MNPETFKKAMRTRSANEGYREHLSERMKGDKNPTRDPKVVEKIREGNKRAIREGRMVPYGRGSGGKGKPPTSAEKAAWGILRAMGFQREVVIKTGIPRGEGAVWYALDFAHLPTKTAVEVDGSSHVNRKELDQRKDAWLRAHGWEILRFPNETVLTTPIVLSAACSASIKLRATTSKR